MPFRLSSPGLRATAPSASSRVRVVPPRFVGKVSSGSHTSPWCQVPPWAWSAVERSLTLRPDGEKPSEGTWVRCRCSVTISNRSSPRTTRNNGASPRSRFTTSWVAASVNTPEGENSMRMSREVSTVNR